MKWQYWVLLNIIVTSLWAVFSKLTRQHYNAATTSFIIISIAWVTVLCTNYTNLKFTWNIGIYYALACGVMAGLTNITYYRFIKQAPFASAMPLNELYIILVPILAIIIFKEGITIRQISGIVTGLITLFLLIG